MRLLFFPILFLIPFLCSAQKENPEYMDLYLPWTDGELIYSEVVEANGKSKEELYNAGRIWFTSTFNSAKAVLDIDDKEMGMMAGKAWSQIYVTSLGFPVAYKLWYRISIEVKEGRYRYQIKNLEFEAQEAQQIGGPSPAENMFKEANMYRSNGKIKPLMLSFYSQMEETVITLENSLQSDLLKKPLKDDW